jgi:hypothetical protein
MARALWTELLTWTGFTWGPAPPLAAGGGGARVNQVVSARSHSCGLLIGPRMSLTPSWKPWARAHALLAPCAARGPPLAACPRPGIAAACPISIGTAAPPTLPPPLLPRRLSGRRRATVVRRLCTSQQCAPHRSFDDSRQGNASTSPYKWTAIFSTEDAILPALKFYAKAVVLARLRWLQWSSEGVWILLVTWLEFSQSKTFLVSPVWMVTKISQY